jgi:hypothetical protein
MDYKIGNEKMRKIINHTCLYGRRVEHRPLFIKYKIIYPTPLQVQNIKREGNKLQEEFNVHLLNNGSIRCYRKIICDLLQRYEVNTDVEQERDNIKIHYGKR